MTFESTVLQLCICIILEKIMLHFCYDTKFNCHETFAEHMINTLCD